MQRATVHIAVVLATSEDVRLCLASACLVSVKDKLLSMHESACMVGKYDLWNTAATNVGGCGLCT